MKISLESTSEIVEMPAQKARIWQGATARGTPLMAIIGRVSPLDPAGMPEFVAELTEQPDAVPEPDTAQAAVFWGALGPERIALTFAMLLEVLTSNMRAVDEPPADQDALFQRTAAAIHSAAAVLHQLGAMRQGETIAQAVEALLERGRALWTDQAAGAAANGRPGSDPPS